MNAEIHLPTLGLVLGSAAIDSINPCAIGVLILMISVMMAGKKSLGRMLLLGGFYIFAIFVTYLLAGLGLLYFNSAFCNRVPFNFCRIFDCDFRACRN